MISKMDKKNANSDIPNQTQSRSGRGGVRKSAGRKPEVPGEPMVHKTVTLTAITLRKLLVLGDGNLSKGVRAAAEVAFDRYQRGR